MSVARKIIAAATTMGEVSAGNEIALRVDQTLTQDATGTLVMLALEAMELERVRTRVSAQYVDHNLLQEDHRNADDHLFLESACRRFGVWFSRPGNGVSHPLHMQCFGRPGEVLLGSDSHTCAGGALGMLAIGAGGVEVALAMAGEPFHLPMPEIWGVRLVGAPPPWVSAKDVILELLRRHGVSGGVGRIIEYHGPGLETLSVWDRHVIANMGAELGATTSVFPSDAVTRDFLAEAGRGEEWREIVADDADFDVEEEIDLAGLEPLVARPSSPGDVVPVTEVAGTPIYQGYVGSSANPGFRDFAVAAEVCARHGVADGVSFDVNPSARFILQQLTETGHLGKLLEAGARLHQAGCNGCIGMGQAPATGRNSLRTVPRNFPGRSGTSEDRVWLASPETVAASACRGHIEDPRRLGDPPEIARPPAMRDVARHLVAPLDSDRARATEIQRGPNIVPIPDFPGLPDRLDVPLLLVLGDDVSTDEILPAGAKVLPFRSNLPKIAEFAFSGVDPGYPRRATADENEGGHAILAGHNYGQGSSREHAAAAPRHLGLRLVLARDYARIHHQNLVNFGVLPLRIEEDVESVEPGCRIVVESLHEQLSASDRVALKVDGREWSARHSLSSRQIDVLRAGGVIPWLRDR